MVDHPWETYTRKCEMNLEDGHCKITFFAVDWSDQVMFVAPCPGVKRDRFGSSVGIIYS